MLMANAASGIQSFSVYLPFVVIDDLNNRRLSFNILNEEVKKQLDGMTSPFNTDYGLGFSAYVMTIGMKEMNSKQTLLMEINFPGKVIPHVRKQFKPTYFYYWHNNYIKICRMVTTPKIAVVTKLAKELLKEAYTFYQIHGEYHIPLEASTTLTI